MQRDIVKHSVDSILFEFVQHDLAIDLRREKDVIHVPVVLTVRGHDRATKQAVLLERGQHLVVALPDRHPFAGNALRLFELRPEESGDDVAWQERRTDILPGIFIDLAPEKTAAIRSLLANDFGAQHQIRIPQKQAAAFTGNDIFGFVKAETADVANGTQRAAFV